MNPPFHRCLRKQVVARRSASFVVQWIPSYARLGSDNAELIERFTRPNHRLVRVLVVNVGCGGTAGWRCARSPEDVHPIDFINGVRVRLLEEQARSLPHRHRVSGSRVNASECGVGNL